MNYKTYNELDHFIWKDGQVGPFSLQSGNFVMTIYAVTILPENSCNRDIRKMGTQEVRFTISNAKITRMIQEGYKVYDADGNLTSVQEDVALTQQEFQEAVMEGYVYSITHQDQTYVFQLDKDEFTYVLQVDGEGDLQEWDRFMNLDNTY